MKDVAPTVSDQPDWGLVPFPVACARCGQDFRGLSEPLCPACGLSFAWSDVLPFEHLRCLRCAYHLYALKDPRCPECGTEFTWEDILDDYHRRKKPLFEYHWRHRPVRSLIKTWWLALRPRKVWRAIDIHDPPSRRGLMAMLVPVLATFFLMPIGAHFVGLFVLAELEAAMNNSPLAFGCALFNGLPSGTVGMSSPVATSGVAVWCSQAAVLLTAWVLGTAGTLLLLRQSMSRCRVRNAHVLRVVAYSLIPAATGWLLWHALVTMADVAAAHDIMQLSRRSFLLRGTPWAPFPAIWVFKLLSLIPLFILLWTTWSVAVANRRYLLMPHAEAVAISSQLVGILFAISVQQTIRGF